MKAILEFDLPEDNGQYVVTAHAMDFALVCWDIDQFLRDKLKYGNTFTTADEALEKTRETLHELLYNYNINLDMIE